MGCLNEPMHNESNENSRNATTRTTLFDQLNNSVTNAMDKIQDQHTSPLINLNKIKSSDMFNKISQTVSNTAVTIKEKMKNALCASCPTCNSDGMNTNIVSNCRTCAGKGSITNGSKACVECSTKGCEHCNNIGYVWAHAPYQLPQHPPLDNTCPKCMGRGGWFLGPSTCEIKCGDDISDDEDWEPFVKSLACVKRHCPACDGLKKLPSEARLCDVCKGKGWNDGFTNWEWEDRDASNANSCAQCKGKCYIGYDYAMWYSPGYNKKMLCPYCEGLGGFQNRSPQEITGLMQNTVTCPCCDGDRCIEAFSRQCRTCYGKGFFDKTFKDTPKYYAPNEVIECGNCYGRCYVRPPWTRNCNSP